MAATVIAPQDVLGAYVNEDATQMTTLTWTAIDIVNTNSITMAGRKMMLLFRNDDVAAKTITISSSENPYGRSADVTAFSMAAGAYATRIFEPVGWEQTLGSRNMIITAEDADIFVAAINL
jgi:hypothetical protein